MEPRCSCICCCSRTDSTGVIDHGNHGGGPVAASDRHWAGVRDLAAVCDHRHRWSHHLEFIDIVDRAGGFYVTPSPRSFIRSDWTLASAWLDRHNRIGHIRLCSDGDTHVVALAGRGGSLGRGFSTRRGGDGFSATRLDPAGICGRSSQVGGSILNQELRPAGRVTPKSRCTETLREKGFRVGWSAVLAC